MGLSRKVDAKPNKQKGARNENESGPVPQRPKAKSALLKIVSSRYILKLYVAGQSPKSVNAIANIKKICEENLQGRYELEVIDLYQQPQLAQGEQIIAVPTLIKKTSAPVAPHHRRYVEYRARAGGAGYTKEGVMPNKPSLGTAGRRKPGSARPA